MANISIGGRLSLLQRVASLDLRYGPYSSITDAYENMGPSGDEVITAGLPFGVTEDDGSVSVYIWTKGEDATQTDCRKLDKEHIILFNGFIDISVSIKQQRYNDVVTKDNIVFLSDKKQFAYRDGLNFYINWKNRYVWSNENLIPYDDVIYIDINDNKAYYYNGTTLTLLVSEAFVSSINNQAPDENGNVNITKEHIGLGNVDNTADTEKVVKGASEDGSGNNIVNTYETKNDATTKQTALQQAINAIQTTVDNLVGLEGTNYAGFSIDATEADALAAIPTKYTAAGYTDELVWYLAGDGIDNLKAYHYNGTNTPVLVSSKVYDFTDFSGIAADVSTLRQDIDALGPEIDKLKPKNIVEDGLWICGSDGKALLRLDQLDSMGALGQNLAHTIKTLINDKLGTGVTKIEASQLGTELTAKIEEIAESKAGKLEPKDIVEDGIWLCDPSGKALLRLDTLDTKGGIGENLANSIKTLIQSTSATGFTTLEAQALGTNITALIEAIASGGSGGGGNTNVIDTVEDGFYIANEEGEVFAKYIDGTWHFGQVDGIAKSVSALAGTNGCRVSMDMESNDKVQVSNYPIHEMKGTTICFGGKITSSVGTIRVGKNSNEDRGSYAEVTSTKLRIVFYRYETETHVAEIEHGLNLSTFVNVLFEYKGDLKAKATVQTLGGWATIEPDTYDVIVNGVKTGMTTINFSTMYGPVTAQTIGTPMTGCKISIHNPYYRCPVWMFGDSYFSVNGSRWIGVLRELGYFNFYLNGFGGRTSAGALQDLRRALNWGTPKYLVFALITNDGPSADQFRYNIEQVLALCKERGITPVFTTQGLPAWDYTLHCEYLYSTGERVIDFAHAVAPNGWAAGSTWYEGLLSSDNAHPTPNGARTLAMQAMKDMPEILQLCKGGLE